MLVCEPCSKLFGPKIQHDSMNLCTTPRNASLQREIILIGLDADDMLSFIFEHISFTFYLTIGKSRLHLIIILSMNG